MRTARPVSLPGVSAPALVIDSAFPVVAVAGLVRPRLLIAKTVLDACSPEELRAILAHEQGHIDRRDNLRRLMLGAIPDVLAWLPLARRIQTAWLEAAEDAADDMAEALGSEGRAVLAQALLRVARLAPGAAPVSLPASALYRGESLDRRIRRLLAPAAHAPAAGAAWILRWGLGGVVLSLALLTLRDIHDLVEAAVIFLP
jgi:beta-lactamase regulating signal transducer with metallopeptidase domain